MNVFLEGKYLIDLKIYEREFCVCGFDPVFSRMFCLLIGLKMWVQILCMYMKFTLHF